MLLLTALTTMVCVSCSDDKPAEPNVPETTSDATGWKFISGDFITQEDVIVLDDSTSMNISKAYLRMLSAKNTPKKGDVISLLNGGELSYFEVTDAKESGEHFISCSVKRINLEKALGLLNVTMDNVQLSTEIYMDKTQPKRVNNSGEADKDGFINTKIYTQKDDQGNTVYHPIAYMSYTILKDANADADGVVPGAFTGCYVGQLDSQDAANAWWDGAISIIKTLGKIVQPIINPVGSLMELGVGAGKIIYDVATKGEVDKKMDAFAIEHEFSGHSWDLTTGKAADWYKDIPDHSGEYWTENKWDDPDVKLQAYLTLNGHLNAHAGASISFDIKPDHVTKFAVGAYADLDVDMNANIELGGNTGINRPIPLLRLNPLRFTFDIGPVIVNVDVYPELIANFSASGEALFFTNFDIKYKKDCQATLQLLPEIKTSASSSPAQEGDVFTLNRLGLRANAELRAGFYLRTSWKLYDVAGPVFDLGPSLKLGLDGSIWYDWQKKQWDGDGEGKLTLTVIDIRGGAAIGFPPLQKISPWLYEKLSIHTDMITDFDIPFYPFKPIELYDFGKLLKEKIGD